MSAAQLPHDARGEPLCGHHQPGRCTWWCSYRRGVLCTGPVVALMIAGGLVLWMTGDEDARERVANAFAAVCLVLGVSVPIVIFVNAASDRP